MIEVLNGSGKGTMKEAFQVLMQEMNESELFDEVSKSQRRRPETGVP